MQIIARPIGDKNVADHSCSSAIRNGDGCHGTTIFVNQLQFRSVLNVISDKRIHDVARALL